MKTQVVRGMIGCLAVALTLNATPGCRKDKPTPKQDADVQEVGADTTAAIEAKLAAADKFDGKIDKVVSKCAGCALDMDGNSEHALEASGYTLLFCSEDCKTGLEKDVTKAVLALKIPED